MRPRLRERERGVGWKVRGIEAGPKLVVRAQAHVPHDHPLYDEVLKALEPRDLVSNARAELLAVGKPRSDVRPLSARRHQELGIHAPEATDVQPWHVHNVRGVRRLYSSHL